MNIGRRQASKHFFRCKLCVAKCTSTQPCLWNLQIQRRPAWNQTWKMLKKSLSWWELKSAMCVWKPLRTLHRLQWFFTNNSETSSLWPSHLKWFIWDPKRGPRSKHISGCLHIWKRGVVFTSHWAVLSFECIFITKCFVADCNVFAKRSKIWKSAKNSAVLLGFWRTNFTQPTQQMAN